MTLERREAIEKSYQGYLKRLYQLPTEVALQKVATRIGELTDAQQAIINERYEFVKMQDKLLRRAKREEKLEKGGEKE